ncbi:FGGY-family carbohydrate kinase [Pseudothermotoga thermarum]|uniref:Carbohydrate kinase, FGGY n=1 Tax=Pseudothermotoga thermarum DSM 5069 TaxID=688269 RepID=F7YTX7_9THEM|nr:FGGY-family carbohydrate kinase [Pseudothermotoga thermarum]AEH51430.1 Carbohydrate kinase, FGGY [Pseudothermotoga thermarum DSM 5069]
MGKETVLAIDCGTQSLRVMLFDSNGRLVDLHKHTYAEPYFSPKPGWAEQDLSVYVKALQEGCKVVSERSPQAWKNVQAVVVTTQRDTCVCVDKEGNPLRPAILWLDQRMARYDAKLPWYYQLGFKIVGMDKAAKISFKKCKANWLRQNEPEIWKKTEKFLLLSGWFHYLLTKKYVDSIANQIGHIPFDYKRHTWADPRDFHSYLFPIEREKLPELVQPGTIFGNITKEASNLTGIKEGTPVVAAGSDKGCETLAAGCLEESMGCASLGTTLTIQITTKRYMEPIKFMPPYPAVVPKHYNPEVEIFRGFWMITWFKKEFALYEEALAQKNGLSTEDLLEHQAILQTCPGSVGLIVQPYWGAGLKMPEARGAIIGFGQMHNKAYLYRAIIEGLSYALRDGIEKIEKVSKVKMKKIVVTGGASKSEFVCQTIADVTGRQVLRMETQEAAGLGASMVGFYGLRYFSIFEEAVKNMSRYEKAFEPNLENTKVYQELYEKVYKALYPKLRPLYKRLQRITGYPEC